MFHGMELEHEGIFESSEEALHLELEAGSQKWNNHIT